MKEKTSKVQKHEESRPGGVRYIVDDVSAAVKFYVDTLGFEVDMDGQGFAMLSKGNLRLLLNQPGAGGAGQTVGGQTPQAGGQWNRIHIPVTDLSSLQTQLKNKGVTFKFDVVEAKAGKQVLLQDPSGNLIELFEPAGEKKVQPVPEGYHTVTPFLIVDGSLKLIEFIENAFGGKLTYIMKHEGNKVMHATVKIGNSTIMTCDASDNFKSTSSMLYLYVNDVDAVYKKALDAGGLSLRKPTDEFYGDRSAGIMDNWNNQWWIATHVEDVSDEEMKKREAAFREQQKEESTTASSHA